MSEEPRKVLIVDDEKRIGELIRSLIHWEELGLTCLGLKTDGEMAWEAIRKEHPDIVITDIRMPVINGIELVERSLEADLHPLLIILKDSQP